MSSEATPQTTNVDEKPMVYIDRYIYTVRLFCTVTVYISSRYSLDKNDFLQD